MIPIVSTGLFTVGDAAIASSLDSVSNISRPYGWHANAEGILPGVDDRSLVADLGGYNWASAAINTEPIQWNGEPWSDLSTIEIRREVSYGELEALEKRVADLEELVKNLWQAKSAGDLL